MTGISTALFASRLSLAVGMGAVIGLERQWRQRMAGTRTNALVAAGAASFLMSAFLIDGDPSARGRIISYIVSGVGFLGAGVIFKDRANIQGLNTAATIWCSAAVGALCGLGASHLAGVLVSAVLLTNIGLRPLARVLRPVMQEEAPLESRYKITLTCALDAVAHMRALLLTSIARGPLTLHSINSSEDEEETEARISAEVTTAGRNNEAVEQVVVRLSIEDATITSSWAVMETANE